MSRIRQIIDRYLGENQPEDIKKDFFEWFDATTDRKEKDEALEEYWDSLRPHLSLDGSDKAYSDTKEKIRRRNFSKSTRHAAWQRILRVAAIFALPVAAGALTYAVMSANTKETVWLEASAAYGQTRSVELADGSQITINSGSRLIYPAEFSGDERRIFLYGEAYADIASDAEREFVLSANDIDILVHGTSFNVRSYADDSEVEVALLDGSIDLRTKNLENNCSVRVMPGELVKLDKRSGQLSTVRFPKGTFTPGLEGNNLTFINSRLFDIASQLERTFDVHIVIDDSELGNERYYSAFVNNESLEQILSALQLNGNLYYKRSGDTIHFYKNKKGRM